MHDSVKYGQLYTAIIMIIGFVVIEILAVPFSEIFELSGETQQLCISAMHIISISFVFAGINIAFQGIFQAMDGGLQSLIISFCRQIIFVFPFALLFSYIAKSNTEMNYLSWLTFPFAELITSIISIIMFRKKWKTAFIK